MTQTKLPFIPSLEQIHLRNTNMEEEKPLVQIILPSHTNQQTTEELSRPPSAFPVEEAERLRVQETAGEGTNDEVSLDTPVSGIAY